MRDFIKIFALMTVLQIVGILIVTAMAREIEYAALGLASYAVAVLMVRGIA